MTDQQDLRQAILDHCGGTSEYHPRYNLAIRAIAADVARTSAPDMVGKRIKATLQQLKRRGVIFWDRSRKRWVIKGD